jgi:hypothetical protein
MVPAPEALAESRLELRRRLTSIDAPFVSSSRSFGFWDRFREGFTIRFHFAPGIAQVAGAAAMLFLGFLTARLTPNFQLGSFRSAGVLDATPMSRVRYVEPVSPGKVQIVVDETRQKVLSGSVDDQAIQRLLLAAAKESSDAGVRVESVDLLKNNSQSAEIRKALLYSLEHDPNPGVRLKALDGLKNFAGDQETQGVLTQVLLKDDNPGVRTRVIDLLVQRHSDSMLGALQEVMEKEDNNYIRLRCEKILQEMNASAEMY